MKKAVLILLAFQISHLNDAYQREGPSFLELFLQPYREFRRRTFALSNARLLGEGTKKTPHQRYKSQEIIKHSIPFPCSLENARSAERPKSVHKLKPGDIDVIGAMGDSLSAGFALRARSILDVLLESRDIAFTGGGFGTWREYLTIPNILKEFNPNLIGYSTKASLTTDWESQFNVAEGGAISQNTPYMARVLVDRIKNDPRVNLKQDWKFISYLIGANDFCSEMCYHKNPEIVLERHRLDLLEVLRYLRDNLPRTMVNLIPPPAVDLLRKFKGTPLLCSWITHSFSCPCIIGHAYTNQQGKFSKIMKRWQQIDFEVAEYDEFNDSNEFAVIVQPVFVNVSFPSLPNGLTDFSVLAEDCFHFSQKGDALVTNSLWNNMLQPAGKKDANLVKKTFGKFLCPSKEHPYIFTRKNSN